jgi:cellulose synthase/poly-beta-1,6-N-acetylglucosamine synthase-like glycosyltransferase
MGISGSRNLGASSANGDVVMFLDSDTLPFPDYIFNTLAQFKENRHTNFLVLQFLAFV